MKFLLDMNLSPLWVEHLRTSGWEAMHWSEIGDIRAPDTVIMQWALENGYIVFTHDLDFGALLAATRANGPSVIQIRIQDVFPDKLANRVVKILQEYQALLEQGALAVIDEQKSRIRILPLR